MIFIQRAKIWVCMAKTTFIAKSKIKSGQVITFKYTGDSVTDRNPVVLVLHPNYHGKLHALNLKNLNKQEEKKLWKITKVVLVETFDRALKVNDPLVIANNGIESPLGFYNKLKNLVKKTDCYRTYHMKNVGSLKFQNCSYEGRDVNTMIENKLKEMQDD